MSLVEVFFKRLTDDAVLPAFMTHGAAAADIALPKGIKSFYVHPGQTVKVPLGYASCIPKGFVGMMHARSGLGVKGIVLANNTGVIDSDYRGEWIVFLLNRGEDTIELEGEMRIAQVVFVAVPNVAIHETIEDLPATARGEGGFGSTGMGTETVEPMPKPRAQIRTTHTTVSLPLSEAAYREIEDKLRDASYDHCFHEDGIDMSGISVCKE